jgi:uncharacterized glyoxalase superfamily protein PhnB
MILEKSNIPKGYNAANMFILVKNSADKFIKFVENVFDANERKEVRTPDKDGTLIHAEIRLGDATIMVADSKEDWPFTPAFIQVYVKDAQNILDNAKKAGASIITEVSNFYNGFKLARFQDLWGNIWWLYEPDLKEISHESKSDVSWHDKKPSEVYSTLINAMKNLKTWNK